jgi:3-oxoacyl-[acyl-carrier protein] reductase
MMQALAGQRALVTGGSRGIGRGIALALADAGADVAVAYRRDSAAAEQTLKELEERGCRAAAFSADVRDAEAVEALVRAARDALGGLDIVVANAGVATRFQPVHEFEPGYFERIIGIDLIGVFNTLRAVLPLLQQQRSGVILTISSVAADSCGAGSGPYSAAKAGVNALTKVIARENAAFNIRCNIISPGLIATEMGEGMIARHGEALVQAIPLQRMGTPEEIGRLAVYLASPDAAWITGKNFQIDGGQL